MEVIISLSVSLVLNVFLIVAFWRKHKAHKHDKKALQDLRDYVDNLRVTLDREYKKFMEKELGK